MNNNNKMATNVDYEFVEELQDELMCSICTKVLNEPQMVNCCEQRFCKNCLTEWMTKNKTCPHCRNTKFAYMHSMRQEDRISKLLVYCANKVHGCKSTLKISEYQHHLSVDNPQGCFFTKLPCLIQCGANLFRGDLDKHCKAKCPKRRVQCQYCKSEGEYQMITGGHTDTCPCYPLACPQACGAEVLRKDLTAHQGVCPLEPVACPFSDIGCKVKVPREDLDKHIQSSMLQHVTDMALSHTATKTQLTDLKQEHEALKEDYTSLKKDYTTLKKDYTALKKDYTALKKDHAALKENNRAKMNATGLFLKDHNRDQAASTITTSQMYTLLVDTSTMKMGSTLSLALSESNITSGHHYILLEGYKFKLEWNRKSWTVPLKYIISLYSEFRNRGCRFKISLNNSDTQTINSIPAGSALLRPSGGGDQLLGSVALECGANITAPILHIETIRIIYLKSTSVVQ